MNSLYDIKSRLVELANREDLTEEEVTELGTILAQELTAKSTNIIGFIRNVETGLEAIDSEIKRLTDMKANAKNKLDRFKEYVKTNMTDLALEKIETPIGALRVQKNPKSVEVLDEEEVPAEYKKEKITVTVDKVAIKKNFEETGEIVPGTRIITDKTNLRVV